VTTLYLDTSALVKLYVREQGSRAAKDAVRAAARVATSRVAYPEARAAFARRSREGRIAAKRLRRIVAALDRDLSTYVLVEVTAAVARAAGQLAERRALRGFDAVHLASALELGAALGSAPKLMAFDDRLTDAALAEGLVVLG
jgi:predicted nucleic acid-binding protein